MKSSVLRLLMIPGAAAPFSMLMRGRATIFMLHRFQFPELGVTGHDPEALRRALAYLRKHKYKLASVDELVLQLREGHVQNRSVAFTIDDGYFDHGAVAAPLFAEFDCPVTTFVASGFIDGTLWYWWDQIEYVVMNTKRHKLDLRVGDSARSLEWQDERERLSKQLDFAVFCTTVPDSEKYQWIKALAETAEVAIPSKPPERYRPMTWDEIRACERSGMTFGAHTVSHPILSRTSDEQSRKEITDSWNRLKACAARACPVFCYPNGQAEDFGRREVETLAKLGLTGAVVGYTGFVGKSLVAADPTAIYKVPRMGYSEPLSRVVQDVSGVERFKQILRGAA